MHNLIRKLSEMAVDEAKGACHYAKKAVKLKDEYPTLAKTLYDMATDEMNHMALLNNEASKLLEKFRADEPDAAVAAEAVYDYLHECQIEEATKAKMYQAQYRG